MPLVQLAREAPASSPRKRAFNGARNQPVFTWAQGSIAAFRFVRNGKGVFRLRGASNAIEFLKNAHGRTGEEDEAKQNSKDSLVVFIVGCNIEPDQERRQKKKLKTVSEDHGESAAAGLLVRISERV